MRIGALDEVIVQACRQPRLAGRVVTGTDQLAMTQNFVADPLNSMLLCSVNSAPVGPESTDPDRRNSWSRMLYAEG